MFNHIKKLALITVFIMSSSVGFASIRCIELLGQGSHAYEVNTPVERALEELGKETVAIAANHWSYIASTAASELPEQEFKLLRDYFLNNIKKSLQDTGAGLIEASKSLSIEDQKEIAQSLSLKYKTEEEKLNRVKQLFMEFWVPYRDFLIQDLSKKEN